MVFLVQIIIFMCALASQRKLATLVIAIAAFFIPDEIPMVDEIWMLATTIRSLAV